MTRAPAVPIGLQRVLVLLVLAALVWWGGRALLRAVGLSSSLDRLPTALTAEERGLINVSLQGAELQTAEDGMMLFPGDSLKTGPNANASLQFFDDTFVRLDHSTDLLIDESGKDSDTSEIRLTIKEGGVWIATPKAASATGTVIHRLVFPTLTFDLPAGTEALASAGVLRVFAATGQGVTVTMEGTDPFIIGEGQQWILPQGTATVSDPYAFRSPIDAAALQLPLLTESRLKLFAGRAPSSPVATLNGSASGQILIVREPAAGSTVSGDTAVVRGTVDSSVATVEVNGHRAPMENGSFALEVAIPDGATELEIDVEAFGSDGESVANLTRIVKRGAATASTGIVAGAPTIDEPAKAGETFGTNELEVVLRGKAPANATGIMVNDYRLQLFSPEKGEWSYIASIALGNMKTGSNTYDIVAVFADDTRSPAARLTIVQGQGNTGTATSSTAATASVSAAASSAGSSVAAPKNNDPLTPGVLSVTAPTAGTSHIETGTGFLLEGKTSKDTASVWVNDYRLQLYKPGVTFWNYVASTEFANLKPGKNTYVIVARNANGDVLDKLEYTVDLQTAPASGSTRSRRSRSSAAAASSTQAEAEEGVIALKASSLSL